MKNYKIMEYNNLDEFIDSSTLKVISCYTDIFEGIETISEFREYLEDAVLYENITCSNPNGVNITALNGKCTKNLLYALLATNGIDGKLRKKLNFEKILDKSRDVSVKSKLKIVSRDKDNLEVDYDTAVNRLKKIMDKNNNFINPYYLINLGIATEGRNTGYIENHSKNEYESQKMLYECFLKEKKSLELYGYKDTLCYDILNYVFDVKNRENNASNLMDDFSINNFYKFYTLASSVALENMANLSFLMNSRGQLGEEYKDMMLKTIRNIKAASVYDKDTIDLFKDKFYNEMRFFILDNNIKTTKNNNNNKTLTK